MAKPQKSARCSSCDWFGSKLVCKACGEQTGSQKPQQAPKAPKYRNNRIRVDGIIFHSKKEAEYYLMLKEQIKQGFIRGFCLQPKFVLVEGNEDLRAITYSSDFVVFHNDGTYEIVDTKGFESEQWKRTYKQFRLKYPNLELEVV